MESGITSNAVTLHLGPDDLASTAPGPLTVVVASDEVGDVPVIAAQPEGWAVPLEEGQRL